jgi:hypothetical protein
MRTLLFLLAFTAVAFAQQPTPSQVALQIDGIVNSWAQTIEAQQKQIADLQKENADLKAKLEKQDAK